MSSEECEIKGMLSRVEGSVITAVLLYESALRVGGVGVRLAYRRPWHHLL